MGFLKLLEGMRFEPLTSLLSLITYLGDELCFMALAMLFFWCINKKQGLYILTVGLAGNVVNQFLKISFRIPRPWVLDSEFTIVESAREAATGYSFPSGHTQTAVGTFGAILLCRKEKWLRALSVAAIILVPFSRMYLGVHTPLDVGVGFLISAVVALLLRRFFSEDSSAKSVYAALILPAILGLFYLSFITFSSFPADVDPANLQSATKNAYTLFGTALGVLLVRFIDSRYINFETKAPLPGQIAKYVLGLLLVVAVKSGSKELLRGLLGNSWGDAARYFLMVFVAGVVWPLSFPLFSKFNVKSLKKDKIHDKV